MPGPAAQPLLSTHAACPAPTGDTRVQPPAPSSLAARGKEHRGDRRRVGRVQPRKGHPLETGTAPSLPAWGVAQGRGPGVHTAARPLPCCGRSPPPQQVPCSLGGLWGGLRLRCQEMLPRWSPSGWQGAAPRGCHADGRCHPALGLCQMRHGGLRAPQGAVSSASAAAGDRDGQLLPVAPGRSLCQYQQSLKQRSKCGRARVSFGRAWLPGEGWEFLKAPGIALKKVNF